MKNFTLCIFFLLFTISIFGQDGPILNGYVLDEDDHGVGDIEVFYFLDGNMDPDSSVLSVMTNHDGFYEVDLNVEHDGPGCVLVYIVDCNGIVLTFIPCWEPGESEITADFTYCGNVNGCWVEIAIETNSDSSATLFAFVAGDEPVSYQWSTGDSTQTITVFEEGINCVTITDANGCIAEACVDIIFHPDPDCWVWIVEGNASLFAEVVGIAPYAYLWNTGEFTQSITPQEPGDYCVTITDAEGCESEACFYYDPWHGQDSLCWVIIWEEITSNGEIQLHAFGMGIGDIKYTWSTGETGESITIEDFGTYCVTLEDSEGCTSVSCYDFQGNDCHVVIGCDPITGGALLWAFAEGHWPISYQWSTGEATEFIHITESGTYCVTITDALGCVAETCQDVDLSIFNDSCFTFIGIEYLDNGHVILFAETTGAAPFEYLWSNGETGHKITVLAEGVYCVDVVDADGCVSTNCVNIGTGNQDCFVWIEEHWNQNGLVELFAITIPDGVLFEWSTGEVTPSIIPNAGGEYCVTVISANGCTATACYFYHPDGNPTDSLTQISGLVFTNSDVNVINDAFVYLIEYNEAEGTLTAVDTVWAQNGFYSFVHVPFGDYLIKAALTMDAPDFSNYLPTYIDRVLFWDEAVLISAGHGPEILADIFMVEGENPGGPGFIGGLVTEGANFTSGNEVKVRGPGDPIVGATILLFDEFDDPVSYGITNSQGVFEFPDLALGTYTVFLEMYGRQRAEFTVTLSDNDQIAGGITFTVNDNNIETTAIQEISEIDKIEIWPNPTSDIFNIRIDYNSSVGVDVTLLDLNGKVLVARRELNNKSNFTFDMSDFAPGFYMLRIQSDSGSLVKKILKQ